MAKLLMVTSGAVVLWLFVRGWSRRRELIWMGVAAFIGGVALGLLDQRSFLGIIGTGGSTSAAATLWFYFGRSEAETVVDRVVGRLIDEGRAHAPALLAITNWVALVTTAVGSLVLPAVWVLRPDLFGAAAVVAGGLLGATLVLIVVIWVRVSRGRSEGRSRR